jgi:hypothetical protein
MNMEEPRSCYSLKFKSSSWLVPLPVTCLYNTSDDVAKCPKCGGPMKTAKQIRRLGWALVVLGFLIASVTGVVTVYLAPDLMHPEHGDSAQEMLFISGLLGVLILCGLSAMINGVSQIKTGRRNKGPLIFMLVIFMVLVLLVASSVFSDLGRA